MVDGRVTGVRRSPTPWIWTKSSMSLSKRDLARPTGAERRPDFIQAEPSAGREAHYAALAVTSARLDGVSRHAPTPRDRSLKGLSW